MRWAFLLLLLFSTPAAEHFRRAATLAGAQKWVEAEREYLAGLALAPETFDAQNNLGVIYFQQEKYDRAAWAFRQAVRMQPGNGEFAFNLGLTLFRLSQTEEALPYLVRGANSKAHARDAHFIAGLCHFHARRWPDAVRELEASLQSGKKDPEVLYLLVKAHKNAGQRDQGIRLFAQLASAYPDSAFVHQLLGEAYDLTHDTGQAEAEFRAAIRAAPDQPDLHLALGYVYWKQRDFPQASEMFQQELRINPRSAASYYYLGTIALQKDEPDRALEHFREARRAGPDYADVYLGMGQAFVKLGRYPDAEQSLRKAVEAFPQRVESHYSLGQVLMRLGKTKEGRAELDLVKELQSQERQRAAEVFSRESKMSDGR
jgi:protein O-GlcNAc transferase